MSLFPFNLPDDQAERLFTWIVSNERYELAAAFGPHWSWASASAEVLSPIEVRFRIYSGCDAYTYTSTLAARVLDKVIAQHKMNLAQRELARRQARRKQEQEQRELAAVYTELFGHDIP